jgi:hypothetical protein
MNSLLFFFDRKRILRKKEFLTFAIVSLIDNNHVLNRSILTIEELSSLSDHSSDT